MLLMPFPRLGFVALWKNKNATKGGTKPDGEAQMSRNEHRKELSYDSTKNLGVPGDHETYLFRVYSVTTSYDPDETITPGLMAK